MRRSNSEMEGDCAEDDCGDVEECGDDHTSPTKRVWWCCYLDSRPFLPLILFSSTAAGGICMLRVQIPALQTFSTQCSWLGVAFAVLYIMTMVTGLYVSLADPGTVPEEDEEEELEDKSLEVSAYFTRARHSESKALKLYQSPAPSDRSHSRDSQMEEAFRLPVRAHKSWMYTRPVRRYDHYCRWVMNVIGLHNHREFIMMVFGLTVLSVFGIVADVALLALYFKRAEVATQAWPWSSPRAIAASVHLAYSAILFISVMPILKTHVRLVSRNELDIEAKHYQFWALETDEGNVSVYALTDQEFEANRNAFVYDEALNSWDQGSQKNCWNFWFLPRSGQASAGEW